MRNKYLDSVGENDESKKKIKELFAIKLFIKKGRDDEMIKSMRLSRKGYGLDAFD